MTQEEKAKAYDEAIERARVWRDKSGMPRDRQGVLDDIFPELRESEGERIRKYLKRVFGEWSYDDLFEKGFKKEDILAWLEKQGEQKTTIEMKTPEESLGVDSDTYNKIVDECIYGEQKPADKIEPKFHVNEWVVTDKNDVVQIKAVNNGDYTIDNGMDFNMPYVDRYWHKWTIQDAKDGDVLADDRTILLFRSIGNRIWKDVISYYAILETNINNRFSISDDDEYWGKIEDCELKPATKEQRKQLEKAMADAGYTFDFEKKELKNIELNHADKVTEEEKPLLEKFKQTVYDCAWGKVTCKAEGETKEEYANRFAERFLLIVRDWADDYIECTIQQKLRKSYDEGKEDAIKENSPAWSEEDVKMIGILVAIFEVNYPNGLYKVNPTGTTNLQSIRSSEIIKWLKSLRPKNRWKPSEGQLEALRQAAFEPTKNWSEKLQSLYMDLKKLLEQ